MMAKDYDGDEWCTPEEYIRCVKNAFDGCIDLDPFSSDFAQQTVQAKKFYNKNSDAFAKEWSGNVFMNPPYSKNLIRHCVVKLLNQRIKLNINDSIVLVNNSTETAWFRLLLKHSCAMCFPRSIIQFNYPDENVAAKKKNRQGQVFFFIPSFNIYNNYIKIIKFTQAFKEIGPVVTICHSSQ